MRWQKALPPLLYLAILLILATVSLGLAGNNQVPGSSAGDYVVPLDANDLKPAACAGMDLTNIISGSGIINGTPGNDLILGSGDADTINGMGGDDCIVGGEGADVIDGGDGHDVCLSLSPDSQFKSCEYINP